MPNDPATQTFKNHAKFVPAFHFFAVPVLDERFQNKKAIKQVVTDWQADHLRA